MGEGYKAKGPQLRTQASDVRSVSDVRKSSDFRKYHSVKVAPDVRWVSGVRALGLVGRPAFVGRPTAVTLIAWSSSGRLGCVRYRIYGGVWMSGGCSL